MITKVNDQATATMTHTVRIIMHARCATKSVN